jgi:hypothetical protein
MNAVTKKTKTRKIKKRIWNKKVGILSYAMAMVVIVSLAVYVRTQQSQQPAPPKVSAEEYFSFSRGFAVATAADPENNTILIKQADFYITAIGGNATNVNILPLQGMVAREDAPHFDKLIQGDVVEVGPISYQYEVSSEKEAEGWPILFEITCNEAEGQVTVNVEDFVQLSS